MRQLIPRASIPYQVMLPPVKMAALGLGATNQQTQSIVGTAGATITPIITTLAAHSAALSLAAGGSGLILGMAPALAVPVIGAALVAITTLATILIKNSGCGQTCIETSQWADQAEKLLEQNIAAYFSNPAPRTESQRNAALANFLAVWARLEQMCSDPSTGNAGKRCISDRQAGACTWKQTSTSTLLSYPGEPQPGECWNWWSGYYQPIADDPVVSDSAEAAAAVNNAVGSLTSGLSNLFNGVSTSSLFLLAGAGLLLFATMGDN